MMRFTFLISGDFVPAGRPLEARARIECLRPEQVPVIVTSHSSSLTQVCNSRGVHVVQCACQAKTEV